MSVWDSMLEVANRSKEGRRRNYYPVEQANIQVADLPLTSLLMKAIDLNKVFKNVMLPWSLCFTRLLSSGITI